MNIEVRKVFPLYFLFRNGSHLQTETLQEGDEINNIQTIVQIVGRNSELSNPFSRGEIVYVTTPFGVIQDKISYIYEGSTVTNLYLTKGYDHTEQQTFLSDVSISRQEPAGSSPDNEMPNGDITDNGSTDEQIPVKKAGLFQGKGRVIFIIMLLVIAYNIFK